MNAPTNKIRQMDYFDNFLRATPKKAFKTTLSGLIMRPFPSKRSKKSLRSFLNNKITPDRNLSGAILRATEASPILLGALAISAFEGAAEGIDRAITQKLSDGGYGEDVFRDMQSCKLKAALAIIGYQTF